MLEPHSWDIERYGFPSGLAGLTPEPRNPGHRPRRSARPRRGSWNRLPSRRGGPRLHASSWTAELIKDYIKEEDGHPHRRQDPTGKIKSIP